MDEQLLRDRLSGLPVPEVRWFDQIGSTNAAAIEWARSGAPDGALVAADRQTAGRGRLGRTWLTNPGAALAFSIVIRPSKAEADQMGLFSPLGALGVASALTDLGLEPQIKWPNDVLLGGRKVCGILAEAVWLGDDLEALVLGIGVNVAPSSVPGDDQVLFSATCVEEWLKHAQDRVDLLAGIIAHVLRWRAAIGQARFLTAWQSQMAFRGEIVQISRPGQSPLLGQVLGIDAEGSLCLKAADGVEFNVQVGDVQLRPHI